jgi:hypothetical protein
MFNFVVLVNIKIKPVLPHPPTKVVQWKVSLNNKLNEDRIAEYLIIGCMNSKITRQDNSSA